MRIRLAALALFVGVAGACGDDLPDQTAPPATAPPAATDPAAVQALFADVYQGATFVDDERGSCAYEPSRLVVLAETDPSDAFDFPFEREPRDGDKAQLGLFTYRLTGGDDPLDVAARLNARGIDGIAAPDYEVFPLPIRMYFPGSLPVPAAALVAPEEKRTGPPVVVLDTGIQADDLPALASAVGVAEDDTLVSDEATDAARQARDLSPIGGHGGFVAGIVARGSTAPVDVYRVQPADSPVFYETDVVDAAIRAMDGRTGPVIANLSLGSTTCAHDDSGASVPVATLAVAAQALLADPGSVLVAAAGNTAGDEDITWPAAFSEPGSLPDSIDIDLAALSKRVIAVGALDGSGRAPYATTGDWVDLYAEGTWTSDYPLGAFTYFATPPPVPFTERAAEWRGSSFATAAVSAQLHRDGEDAGTDPADTWAAWQAALPGAFQPGPPLGGP